MTRMDLTIVGCTGSMAGPDSPASCYLVRASDGERDWQLLLDLGSGALGALQRHTDPLTLDAVLLTHLHPDHCLDLTGLRVLRAHGPRPAEGSCSTRHGPRSRWWTDRTSSSSRG